MTLRSQVRARLGTLELEAALEVEPGEVVAVVGPNGAGKTTWMRVLAGLVGVEHARVELDGALLDDTAAGLRVPPERRSIGVVFQDHLLFPHLSAADNVAFGLRSRGEARQAARRRALGWLERVGAVELAESRPRSLSGGQAQRVALARALAVEPHLLLLDEPLASVDRAARAGLRRLLRDRIGEHPGPRLLVTHDPVEALALATRLVVLERGRIAQDGAAVDVVSRPRTPWVAEMLGLNLLRGRGERTALVLAKGASVAAADPVPADAFAVIHPRSVTLHRSRPEGSARNVWRGAVLALDLEGDRARVRVGGEVPLVAEVTPAAIAELGLASGGPVWMSVKATEVSVYPA